MEDEVRIEECVVRVRPLEEEDLPRLEWEGGEDYRAYYLEEWERHQQGIQPVWVADFNGYPIGQVTVNLEDDPPIIEALRVMEPFRNLGIGSALLRQAEECCRARGCTTVSIGVNTANNGARQLYERAGYEAVGEPYDSEWYLTDRHGRSRRQCETVQLMRRRLE